MQYIWQKQFRGGHAKIRPYAPALCGVGYVLKSLDLADLRAISSASGQDKAQSLAGVHVGKTTSFAGANQYEMNKIGRDGQGLKVTVSLGVQGLLHTVANDRRGAARSVAFFRRRSGTSQPHTQVKKAAA